MPTITDWLMVVITFVYVIATILICVFNYKSAKASKEQLEEMRRQYSENDRPRIETEFLYVSRTYFGIRFKNVGTHTALNVQIEINDEFLSSIDSLSMTALVRKQKGKECVIGIGQNYDLFFGEYNDFKQIKNKVPAKGRVKYQYYGKVYTTEFEFDFENYYTIFSCESDKEKIRKELSEISHQLRQINMNSIEGKTRE